MITHSTSPLSHVGYEKEKNLDIHATKENHTSVSVRLILMWFGVISTILFSVAALAPGIFGIPANLRPWVFLIAIFWAVAFCAGMFDL